MLSLVGWLCVHFEAFEALAEFVERHDRWQLDEYIVVLFFAGVGSVVLLFRRSRDLYHEIVRREASEEEAIRLARHDSLTGLPNRRVLSEELAAALEDVRSAAAECAVLLIDLDRFKPINDLQGHAMGDAVLVEVADRIREVVGGKGTIARLGGDEFACVIPYEPGSDIVPRLGGQIIRVLNQPLLIRGTKLQIGATVGIARAPQDGTDPSQLLHAADLAMYEQKREGRGSYRFFHAEMDVQLRDRSALEADLRGAVGAKQIIPHFQPITNLSTGDIIGFEALARWLHPTRGTIMPDSFIPIAEDLGIIDQVTYTMLREAAAAARLWPPSIWVSINLSPLQLKDPWVASRLLAILTEAGLAPGRLIVEVTENAVIDDIMKARQVFTSLQNAGVRIALDDFGKGYSSLYHLRQLNFDQLKLDGSFVHSMDMADSAKIVSAVAGLGKSLGMPVTAEGVETEAEAASLRALGCEHAQGFLFGKPLSAADTLTLLKNPRAVDAAKRSA
jgi:diguanylate cyclase (GGDEF)-like protein